MKFIVSSTTLFKQLQNLIGVISTSNTLPILDNFLFDISKRFSGFEFRFGHIIRIFFF